MCQDVVQKSSFKAKDSPCVATEVKGAKLSEELAVLPSRAFHNSLWTTDGKAPLCPGTAPLYTAHVLLAAPPC